MRDNTILSYVIARELGSSDSVCRNSNKCVYQELLPNKHLLDVITSKNNKYKISELALKTFTQDGRYLVTFSLDKKRIIFFSYNPQLSLQGQICFDSFFKIHREIRLLNKNETLNHNFILFINDGRHVLVYSHLEYGCDFNANRKNANCYVNREDNFANLNSLNYLNSLFYIRFYLIDIETADIVSIKDFQNEYFHNNNISINYLGNNIMVNSVKNQVINIYHITENGKWIHHILLNIGPNPLYCNRPTHIVNKIKDTVIKEMIFEEMSTLTQFIGSVLFKCEFVNTEEIMITLNMDMDGENVGLSMKDMFFIVFNINTLKVVDCFVGLSEELFRYLKRMLKEPNFVLNRIYDIFGSRTHLPFCDEIDRILESISEHDMKSLSDVRDVFQKFPLSIHDYTESPFLDIHDFIFKSKIISNVMTKKVQPKLPVRFYSRETNKLRFILPGLSIWENMSGSESAENFYKRIISKQISRKTHEFVFHPFEPFIISINNECVAKDHIINFYFRST